MRVGILGPLEATVDGAAVTVGGARLRTLLIRLALDAGRTVTTEALADAVWPGEQVGPAGQANALQTLVARLRRMLPRERLLSVSGGYRLDLPPDAVDATRFERLAQEGRRALKDGEPDEALRHLREALGLWRGEAVVEMPDASRRRLDELRLAAREDRAEAALALHELDGLVAELEELTVAHPFRERPRGLLIKALQMDGRQAEALTVYEEFRGFLADELGADPGPAVQEAHLAVLRGETSPARPRGNVRAAMTSFVGRADELSRLRTQLADHRLVTLVGPGGVGKTRLATTAAADAPAGAWLVDFAPVNDSTGVVPAAVAALGSREVGSPDPMDALAGALGGSGELLVLDNCEHLLDATACLAVELMGRCPGLRVIVTSREPLGIPEETLCPVPPLAPEAAVRLFTDRGAAVMPGFAVSDGTASVVAEICRRLDGLPLAIELTAARLRSVPLPDLAALLTEHPAPPGRTTDPRHRTLHAVVAWSWNLLDDDERRIARRLAAFPGVIAVDSAEAVAAAGIDLLASLADKSLLQFDGEHYRMLQTIRTYALDQLAQSGEQTRVRAAHAAYFTGLAERAERYLRSRDQIPWIARLNAERDNLTAAFRFADETGDASLALRLCAALGPFWLIRGDHHALTSWTRLALDNPGRTRPEARAVPAALNLLATAIWSGEQADEDLTNEIRSLLPGLDETDTTAFIPPILAFSEGDLGAAATALGRLRSHPDAWVRAMAALLHAILHGNSGDVGEMSNDLEFAIAGFRALGERSGLAWSLTARADLWTISGEFDEAIAKLTEAIRLLRELDPADTAVSQRVWLAEARARRGRQGDSALARVELRELLQHHSATLTGEQRVFARITLGDLDRRDGDLKEAARQLDRADEELRRTSPADALYRVTLDYVLSDLALDRNELETALVHITHGFESAAAIPDPALVAVGAARLARLRSRRGDPASAAELLGAAHTVIGDLDALDSDLVRLGADLQEELGEHAYTSAYARGRKTAPDQVLTLVRAGFDSPAT